MTTTHSISSAQGPLSLTWAPLAALWGYFGPDGTALESGQPLTGSYTGQLGHSGWVDGSLARMRVSDGRLLVAAVVAVAGQGAEEPWRASFVLDDLHLVHTGFASQEVARRDAEETLSAYLQQRPELLPGSGSTPEFDQPVEEMLAMLAVLLDDGWQVAHVSQYHGVWVAVCLNDARTALLDLVFSRDFRERGPLDLLDHSARFLLDQPPADLAAARALSIGADVRRSVAAHLLDAQVPFGMEPLTERLYRVTVPAGALPVLQARLDQLAESGLVDGDGEAAWFRYKGALLSFTESQPGSQAEYHYRYETVSMGGPKEFDVRDLATLPTLQDHRAAIRAAIDSGELRPDAPFLGEPSYELWELS